MRAVVALAALVSLGAAQRCYTDQACSWTTQVAGTTYSWDFSNLCLGEGAGDYNFDDGLGHSYYANICGNANQQCLPQGWLETYEYGVAVQMWGSTPTCDRRDPSTLNCLDKATQLPVCCTSDCQVLGVMSDAVPPTFSLINGTNPQSGVQIRYTGAPPDDDDPFWCPWNPYTGEQYPRTVSMIITCDAAIYNGAVPLLAIQNTTEDCDYTLLFATAYGCPNFQPSVTPTISVTSSFVPSSSPSGSPTPAFIPVGDADRKLSGGWVFVIFMVVSVSVYLLGGMFVTYRMTGVWEPPNRHFWSSVFGYVDDGVDFVLNCDRRRRNAPGGVSAFSPAGTAGGGTYSQFAPSASAAPTTAVPTTSFGASGGYNASSSGAYSDL